MTTLQRETATQAEPLTLAFTFTDRSYSMDALVVRLAGVQELVQLLAEEDQAEGVRRRVPPEVEVRRVFLSSPLEVWVGVATAGAPIALLLAARLVSLAREMSRLRVDLQRDRFEAEKYRQAFRLLKDLRPDANTADLNGAADALGEIEVLVVEASGDIPEEVVIVGSDSSGNAIVPSPFPDLDAVVDEMRERMRRARDNDDETDETDET